MRNYFNTAEQSYHLILMSAMVQAKRLLDSSAPTEEEKKYLKQILAFTNKLSESIFGRLGDGYMRSIKNKAQLNELKLMSKGTTLAQNAKMEDFIDRDILCSVLDLVGDLDCENCNNTDCKKCEIYKIKSYLNYNGKAENNDLCPYRIESENKNEFDYLDELGEL